MEPDISVICDRDKLDEKGCQGARLYWIVDPEAEMVTAYDFEVKRFSETDENLDFFAHIAISQKVS